MIRTVIQWMIMQKVDDNVPLGSFLSWVVRHDSASRQYYESLLRLGRRLERDAVELLEQSTRKPREQPLRALSRSLVFSGSRSTVRRRIRTSFAVFALSTVFVFGAGALFSGWIFPLDVTNYAEASSRPSIGLNEDTTSDPVILCELIRLCRQSPNEAGPFFSEPLN